jgi:PqqA peptide cyclase
VREAHELGFYTNLITSGVGLNDGLASRLRQAGLDHVQLSFQDSTRELNDFLSHSRTFNLKMQVARTLKQHGYPIVLNVVIHRQNIDHVSQILDMAERLEVDYLELANVQFYGWAFLNRDHLLPSREQVARAEEETQRFRERVGSRLRVYFVVSDYFENRPKRCMNGWGSVFLAITADGLAMPCHQARMLPAMSFPSVKENSLRSIWYESDAFNRFRGLTWMKEPCRSCPERTADLGGCRCQAFLLTGDPANPDPVCELVPTHSRVLEARQRAQTVATQSSIRFRDDHTSRSLSASPIKGASDDTV